MMLFMLLINIFLLANANNPQVKPKKDKSTENVLSEKETINGFDENDKTSEKTFVDEDEKQDIRPLQINTLKVVQDNISGDKHSSFSEDQSANRGDESTVADIQKQAEKKLEEKSKLEKDNSELITEKISSDVKENENFDSDVRNNIHNMKTLEPPDKVMNQHNSEKYEKLEFKENVNKVEIEKKVKGEVADQENENDPSNAERIPDTTLKPTLSTSGNKISDFTVQEGTETPQTYKKSNDIRENQLESNTNLNTEVERNEQQHLHSQTLTQEDHSNTDRLETQQEDKLETIKTQDVSGMQQEVSKIPIIGDEDVTVRDLFYKDALKFLTKEEKDLKKAYKFLSMAADKYHIQAMEKVAYPYLFGDYGLKRNISKAVDIFQHLADSGSPVGQQGLGFIYGAGLGVNSSQAKSVIYTTFSALGGDTMGQMMLGYRYLSGIGVAQSCESALTYYKKVATTVSDEASPHGNSGIIHRIRLYDELEQPGGGAGHIDEDLLQYYQFLADKGDLPAQVGLGQLYFQGGRGVDINYEKAFKYFNLVGTEGNGNGLAYLGKMYLEGLYVKKDIKTAYEYFKKAAEQKNPIAQAGLGTMYLKGIGVKKDYDAAIKYFSQAAEQGWVEGQLQLGQMYYNGVGVKKDYRNAVKYFTFASQSGHVLAFYNLASMHATGAGVMRSCQTAAELFKNVAERGKWSMALMDAHDAYKSGDIETALLKYYFLAELGYEVAQSNVAYILDKGETYMFSLNQTYARALLQWSRAAHQGYTVARVKVGDYHFYGLGTKVDYEAATLHYRLASDQQNPQAMFNLGYMHEQGLGLKMDIHLAKRFYDMAAESSIDAQLPVYVALAKLAFYFGYEWIAENYRFWELINAEKTMATVYKHLGPDWDAYVITFLAGLLVILLLFRQAIRR